jgi:hypothetical protein
MMRCTACHRPITKDASYDGSMLGPVCAARAGNAARLLPKPEKPAKAATASRVRLPKVRALEADPAQLELALMP